MLRFHKFTNGAGWIKEYGNPDVAEDFEFIYKLVYLQFIAVYLNDIAYCQDTLLYITSGSLRMVNGHLL